MGIMNELKGRWFFSSLCIATALFFMAALVLSSVSYIRVMDARESIILSDGTEHAEVLENGTLVVMLTIELRNPSKLDLSIATLSWNVQVDVSAFGNATFVSVASAYKSPTEQASVSAGKTEVFEYVAYVTDEDVLERLLEFIAASGANGQQYTLETLPYVHDFRLSAWLGDYQHDFQYSGELYLNDMVKIDRRYYGGVYS